MFYVSAQGASHVSVNCPSGSSLTGSGFNTGGYGVKSFMPADGPDRDTKRDDRVILRADGFDTVQAVCIPGRVKIARRTGAAHANRGGVAKAACPAGTRVVGGGENIAGPAADARLNSSAPFDGSDRDTRTDDGWRVRMFNSGTSTKHLTAYALCRSEPATYLGPSEYPVTSDSVGLGTGECDQQHHVFSTWARINRGAGGASLEGLLLVDDTVADSDSVPDDYGNVIVQRDDPSTTAAVTYSVICGA